MLPSDTCYHVKDNQGRDIPTKIRCSGLTDQIMVNVMCQYEDDEKEPDITSCRQISDTVLNGNQMLTCAQISKILILFGFLCWTFVKTVGF